MVSFFPTGDNDPLTWHKGAGQGYADDWREDLFYENWRLIINVSADLEASGLSYYIDLMNEAIYPHESAIDSSDPEGKAVCRTMERYCRELWSLYTRTFGKDHTVGFSIGVDDWDRRVANFRNIYGDCTEWGPQCNGPYVISAHVYSGGGCDELCRFTGFDAALTREGYPTWNTGIIIGEAYYNDSIAANNFAAAVALTGRTIFYVLQWPIQRGQYCPGQTQERRPDVPIKDFSNYLNLGF